MLEPHDIRVWRQARGLSQAGFAEKVFVSRSTVIRWESGDQAIPEMLALALRALESQALDLSSNSG